MQLKLNYPLYTLNSFLLGNYNANKQNIYFKACHLKSLKYSINTVSVFRNTIRYDTIEEINLDSNAEYTA